MSLREIKLSRNLSLTGYTTIKIGGVARYFFVANNIEDLRQILTNVGTSFYLLGRGSNLLIKDTLIEKPVIKLGEEFNYARIDGDYLEAGAATPLPKLLNFCIKNNIGGFANLAGIPATVGGMLVMNASSFSGCISSNLLEVDVLGRDGKISTLKQKDLSFSYRSSSLSKRNIILRARFRRQEEEKVRNKISDFLKLRGELQPLIFPSCGCIFKNPKNFAAAHLIDACGIKGLRRNDAQVSPKHANFIVNLGKASYHDVDYLIGHIREQVARKFRTILEEEIERWT